MNFSPPRRDLVVIDILHDRLRFALLEIEFHQLALPVDVDHAALDRAQAVVPAVIDRKSDDAAGETVGVDRFDFRGFVFFAVIRFLVFLVFLVLLVVALRLLLVIQRLEGGGGILEQCPDEYPLLEPAFGIVEIPSRYKEEILTVFRERRFKIVGEIL